MKDRHILIRRDDEDYHLDLYVDEYECYTLGHVYDLEMHIRLLRNKGKKYLIRTEKQLRTSDHKFYVISKVLELLESTNCGCCDSPWITESTFDAIAEQFRKYEGVI